MIKLTLHELIERVHAKTITLPANTCYSEQYLSALEQILSSKSNIRYSSARRYLVEPYYYSEKSGFLYQYIWGQCGYYYVDFALSTAECIFSGVDQSKLQLIAEDMKDISTVSGFKFVEFNPFCFSTNKPIKDNEGFLTVESPLVDVSAQPYVDLPEFIAKLPFNSKKRNKLSQVYRKFADNPDSYTGAFETKSILTTNEIHALIDFFESRKVYSWLRTRHKGEAFNNAMNSLVTSLAYFAIGKGIAFTHYHEGEVVAVAWACKTNKDRLTFLGIAQNPSTPKEHVSDIGVYSILKFIGYCGKTGINYFDPTCETYPFTPSSIDVYKSKVHNLNRQVYCGRIYSCDDAELIKEVTADSDCPVYNVNGNWNLNDYDLTQNYVHPSKVK